MKIIALSDMHGILPEIPECELVCICGDISPSRDHTIERQKKWFEEEFMKWIEFLNCGDVILVPGNHDIWLETISKEDISKYEESSHYKLSILINNVVELEYDEGNLRIFGTPYCTQFYDWAFMRTIP